MKTPFCVICGVGIVVRHSLGRGINYPICKSHDCLETYLNLRKASSLPRIDKNTDRKAYIQQQNTERYDGFCGRCGKPLGLNFRNNYLRHPSIDKCEKAPTLRGQLKSVKRRSHIWVSRYKSKPKPRIYLKPWQDPESLFCDTEFLETKILRKKIRTGKECGDVS